MFTSRDDKTDTFPPSAVTCDTSSSHEQSPSPTEVKYSPTLGTQYPSTVATDAAAVYSSYAAAVSQAPISADNHVHQDYFHKYGGNVAAFHQHSAFPQPSPMNGSSYMDPKDALYGSQASPTQRASAHYMDTSRSGGFSNAAAAGCPASNYYDNRMSAAGPADSNFNFPFQSPAHLYRNDFGCYLTSTATRSGYQRNLNLSSLGGPMSDIEMAKYHMTSPTTPSTPTSTRSSPNCDPMDSLPPPKMKEHMLCAVCGDNAACQHYGVRTCEGASEFVRYRHLPTLPV